MNFNSKKIVLLIVLALMLAAAFTIAKRQIFTVKIQIVQKCNHPATAQLFYDAGSGYNELDSIKKDFSQEKSSRTFRIYTFKKIRSIRYDPSQVADDCKIYRVEFLTSKSSDRNLNLSLINKVVNATSEIKDGILIIKAENDDPILDFGSVDRYMGQEKIFIYDDFINSLKIAFAIILILTFINFTIKFLSKDLIVKFIEKYTLSNPLRSIFIVSVLSVLISNYPVVYFHKSFVSPVGVSTITNNGSWIKDFRWNGGTENFRGSDIGAMAWAIKPNSIVAARSIFEQHEFPFYNRYIGAGAPLYGQANNLIGDPLNFIPYIFENIETGWDVKFILSRLIFVFGVGVLLLKLNIANLHSILLTTFATSFLGYFAFRFNHPAVFCLTYAPWLLISWINFSNRINNSATLFSQRLIILLLLIIFSWLMLNSGPIKETLIFVSYIQFIGGLFFLYAQEKGNLYHRWFSLLIIYVCLILVCSPYLLTFLDALHQSYTVYDNPAAIQLSWGHLLGLFNLSYSPMLLVSTNLFFLFGFIAFFNNLRSIDILEKIFIYPALFCFLIVFGVIPAVFLVKIPFLNNIIHVWNVFSIPIMFSIIIISSVGLTKFIEGNRDYQKEVYLNFIKVYCVLFLLVVLYFIPKSTFYFLFGLSLVLYWVVYKYLFNRFNTLLSVRQIMIFMLILVLPEGQHLMTDIKFLDINIINPMPRANESKIPDSIHFIKNKVDKEPSRVIGESELMFPGFSGQFGLEGVVTVEPLRNKNFEHFLDLMGYPDKGWGWLRLIDQTQFDNLNHGLNMLGVKYVIANKGTPVPKTMKMAFGNDNEFDVWQNPTAWPRAFFTSNLKIYKTDEEFKRFLDSEPNPFIALDVNELSQYGNLDTNKQVYVPADKYHLTNNKTDFHINVTTKGFVVISNAFYPDDFILRVNGKRVNYFRANMAFIGCYIDKPGNYDFEIEYRPKHFKRYLLMLFAGLLIGVLVVINFGKFKNKK